MTHKYADKLVNVMSEMSEFDFATNPGIRFMCDTRHRLIDAGFEPEDAELIVSRMEIQLPQDSVTPEQLTALVVSCTTVMIKLRATLLTNGFDRPALAIASMASKFSLKLV